MLFNADDGVEAHLLLLPLKGSIEPGEKQSLSQANRCAGTILIDFSAFSLYNKGMFEMLTRKYAILVTILTFLFIALFSEHGLLDYVKLKRQISATNRSIAKLESENLLLKVQVDRLQKDDRYLEELARQKFGFIREGEKVYRIEK
jgi:cell division protein FtsB